MNFFFYSAKLQVSLKALLKRERVKPGIFKKNLMQKIQNELQNAKNTSYLTKRCVFNFVVRQYFFSINNYIKLTC